MEATHRLVLDRGTGAVEQLAPDVVDGDADDRVGDRVHGIDEGANPEGLAGQQVRPIVSSVVLDGDGGDADLQVLLALLG